VFRLHLLVRRVSAVALAPLKSVKRMFMGLLLLAAARASSNLTKDFRTRVST
jgi:hypothetical protein